MGSRVPTIYLLNLKIFKQSTDTDSKAWWFTVTKISSDRLAPISFDVGVSIQQSSPDKSKQERKRDRKPAPADNELEISDDEPKHQFDDLA
jgi:hypothetical protein